MALIFELQTDAPTPQQFLSAQSDGTFEVPDAALLFNGTFSRAGQDLLIANDGADTLRIVDYFATPEPADLYAPDGAVLRGAAVERLAGPIAPGQYVQTGTTTAFVPIGQVEAVNGDASVQRVDGIVEPLSVGMKIFQDDVLQTADGGSLSVTFVDGTIFTLTSGSRMIIDELIYDPASASNTGTFNLIQGGFVFIAGQVAKTGGMDVNTPSATMGIRGTTVIVEVQAVNGVVVSEVSLTRDPDGDVGEIVLRNINGDVVANIVDTTSKWIMTSVNGDVRQVERSLADDAEDNLLIAEAVAAYRSAFARVDAGDTFVTLGDASSGNSGTSPTEEGQENFQVDSIDEPTGIKAEEREEPQQNDETDGGSRDEGNLLLDEFEVRDISVAGLEDNAGAISGGILGVGAVASGLVFQLTSTPANGIATVRSDGQFSFAPNLNFNGQDSFNYAVTQPNGTVVTGTVRVNILPVNDNPDVTDVQTTVEEDGSITGVLTAGDIDGDPLTFSLDAGAANGGVVLLPNGTYNYTPNPDFSGVDTFRVLVSDGQGGTGFATITVTVTGTNDAPVIDQANNAVSGGVTEDGTAVATGQLTATDVDAGPAPQWSGSTAGTLGSFAITAGGTWTYTLNNAAAQALAQGQTVTEVFSATATDAAGATAQQEVRVTVTGTNDAPVIDQANNA
ncbi:tandem-95 repeat protein, partial [Sulfitobacter sp.]|uniref:tandem-95 repeat protein n=1 Tax=Sulfitobacter sp. TaxID=1903071 RepID=UPI0030019752